MHTFWLIYLETLYPNVAKSFSLELTNCCMKCTSSFKISTCIRALSIALTQVGINSSSQSFSSRFHYAMFISNTFPFLGGN